MKKFNFFIKKSLVSFYRTPLGQRCWNYAVKQINRPFLEKAITKALSDRKFQENRIDSPFPLHNLSIDKNSKHALVVFPFLGENAASNVIRDHCKKMREVGYVVHALHYSTVADVANEACFDTLHFIKADSSKFGNWNIHKNSDLFERNEIDDWITEDLLKFVEFLDMYYHFDVCVCNYNFLSACLEVLRDCQHKIIFTHDTFVRRNKKLFDAGTPVQNFYFSCSEEEEKKGLSRAHVILAIQDQEADFFSKRLGLENVSTLPYIPEKCSNDNAPKTERTNVTTSNRELIVGYLAGPHYPNVVALKKFLENFPKTERVKLLIGGGISVFFNSDEGRNIEVLGRVNSLDEFYSKCDLCINPDTLVSGLKIKTLEAMVYGLPVICTEASSTGLGSLENLHNLRTEKDVALSVLKLADSPESLRELKKQSELIVSRLRDKYSSYAFFSELYSDSLLKKFFDLKPEKFLRPKVSVILPCYKVEKYLKQAILSVCSQTLKEIEIIPVDNGSPDSTGRIIEELASLDERIVPVTIPVNKGYGGAINEGLKRAKGEYISIVEPDDWISPNMLETLYKSSDYGRRDVVKAGFFKHFTDGKTFEKNLFFDLTDHSNFEYMEVNSDMPEIVLGESSIWSAIYKRSFLEKNKIEMARTPGASYQDLIWKFSVYSATKKIKLIKSSFYHYRVHTQNSSSKSDSQPLIVYTNFELINQDLKLRGEWDKWGRLSTAHFYLDLVFHEDRLSPKVLPQFYKYGQIVLEKLEKQGMGIEKMSFPPLIEPYVFGKVFPVIKRIKDFKTE